MDLHATDEQRALVAMAHGLFSRHSIVTGPPTYDAPGSLVSGQWGAVVGAGLAGLGVPLDLGGEGGSALEQALVIEEAGKALLAAPLVAAYAATGALSSDPSGRTAVPLLLASDQPTVIVPDPVMDEIATSSTTALSFASHCDVWPESQVLFPVSQGMEGLELHLIAGRDVDTSPVSTLDVTRPRIDGRVQLGKARVVGVASGGLRRSARRHHQVLLAAEAVGIGQACLDVAVQHVSTRQTFGRPIATYQAVAFPLADTYAELTLARSLVRRAAWALDHEPSSRDSLAAAVLAMASETAVTAAERSIQVHGGIGMTWESPLHRYYKRALATAVTYGGSARLRRDFLALRPAAHPDLVLSP